MKMYIVLKSGIDKGISVNSAAHASLICYLRFKDDPDMQEWLATSFKKVVCVASDEEFEQLKKLENSIIVTESRLNNAEVGVVLAPRAEWPPIVKKLKLFR
jgi:peptidyl-tRNA hydrolase